MSSHDRFTGTSEKNAAAPAAVPGTLERWTIDPTRSKLGFSLRHLVIQQIRGQFTRWGGELFLDRVEPWLSSLHVWVDLASLETDAPERDEHVRGPEFLDVAHFPRADFKSTNVEIRDERVELRGRLDLHGAVSDVDLQIRPGGMGSEPDGAIHTRYTARGSLDRQTHGLHWNQDLDVGGIVVGDRIEIMAEVELLRAA